MITRWRPWNGGDNPVPGQRVMVMMSDGNIISALSDQYDWHDKDDSENIVAYRLIDTTRLVDRDNGA